MFDHAPVVARKRLRIPNDIEIVAMPHGSKPFWSSGLVKVLEAAPCLFCSVEE